MAKCRSQYNVSKLVTDLLLETLFRKEKRNLMEGKMTNKID